MSDEAPRRSRQELIAPGTEHTETGEQAQFRELMEVERARIDSANRRTDVVKSMVDAQLEQNRREYEFANKRLEVQEASEARKIGTFRTVIFTVMSLFVTLIGFLTYIAFYGADGNSEIARTWLTSIFQALGSGATIWGFIHFSEHFLKERS